MRADWILATERLISTVCLLHRRALPDCATCRWLMFFNQALLPGCAGALHADTGQTSWFATASLMGYECVTYPVSGRLPTASFSRKENQHGHVRTCIEYLGVDLFYRAVVVVSIDAGLRQGFRAPCVA